MSQSHYMVKVFLNDVSGPSEQWFATRMQRALWLLENGYSSMRVLGFSDPANDARPSVFDVDDPDDEAAAPGASETARSVRQPMDHQPKAQRTRHAKPGRFDSTERRQFNLAQIAARVNAGVLTAASYLKQLGADDDLIRRFASPLGKRVKALAASKGIAPALSGLAVVGHRLVRCLAYDVRDVEILRAAAEYGRVSHLLNGAS